MNGQGEEMKRKNRIELIHSLTRGKQLPRKRDEGKEKRFD